jgi:hypothetical protein
MKYFLGFLAVITLVVVVFIIILRGFTGGGAKEPKQQVNLMDYVNSQTVVKFTVTGPVQADPKHMGYRITVGRDASTIEIIQGYQNNVVKAQTYSNNSAAYADFLRALQLENYTKGDADKSKEDTRGVCPNGNRYTYEVETAGQAVQRYWSTSCGTGTFQGKASIVRGLFSRQIPDFSTMTANVNLGT